MGGCFFGGFLFWFFKREKPQDIIGGAGPFFVKSVSRKFQRSVWPGHNPTNRHCIQIYKFTNPYLATLRLGCSGIRVARSWIFKFVNNKRMTFLQSFVSQKLLFYFQNIWIQCRFNGLCLWSNRSLHKTSFLHRCSMPNNEFIYSINANIGKTAPKLLFLISNRN